MDELEKLVNDTKPPSKPSRMPLTASKFGYTAAIVVIDAITAYTIFLLSYWYYGVVWFLAGAISFYLHQQNWEHPGANEQQERNASVGMIVSVGSMFIMAVFAGVSLIMGWKTPVIESVIVAFVIVLFFWHSLQLALFYFSDDEWKIQRSIARARATADKKVKIAKAAGDVVGAYKEFQRERDSQHTKHGNKGAVDAAMNKISGYAMETDFPKLDGVDNKPRT
jgi:hypothetical protein